jgi:hypothetical protein
LIRSATATFHVKKIEGNYIQATLGQTISKQLHEATQLICASTMTQHERYTRSCFSLSRIN